MSKNTDEKPSQENDPLETARLKATATHSQDFLTFNIYGKITREDIKNLMSFLSSLMTGLNKWHKTMTENKESK